LHNNYYFLRQISKALQTRLSGAVVSDCFSQAKDELVIQLETQDTPFFIRASLTGNFSCLSFPRVFHRARKNSVDLFPSIMGHRVEKIETFENERALAIHFNHHKTLVFKLHGNRSNILLFEDNAIVSLFKNSITSDWKLQLDGFSRSIDWTFDAFTAANAPDKLYFTFGKWAWEYLGHTHSMETRSQHQKWDILMQLRNTLESPQYYITRVDGQLILALFPIGEVQEIFQDPIQAANSFFNAYLHQDTFLLEKTRAISKIKKTLQGHEAYYEKNLQKLKELQASNSYKHWADLIMANLHHLKTGDEKASLPDFYNDGVMIDIKLKRDLTPQKNAELYYRKAKNQHIEIERLTQSLEIKTEEILNTQEQLETINNMESDLKVLRNYIAEITKPALQKSTILPYHAFDFKGFKIWVGKNAQSNDSLTFGLGYKEDLWLHAKDVTGSHVLIKYQAGKSFPKDVIERAAELAAYNSKRKTDSLCPVIVTPKKFVRKRKGDPAGAVVVEKESVIMVTPKL
jgi:predicted ribosome quality control (RQC) complex YloA/Tae2 family protein